jgi:hypothetical protein
VARAVKYSGAATVFRGRENRKKRSQTGPPPCFIFTEGARTCFDCEKCDLMGDYATLIQLRRAANLKPGRAGSADESRTAPGGRKDRLYPKFSYGRFFLIFFV